MRRPPRSWLIGRTTIQPDSKSHQRNVAKFGGKIVATQSYQEGDQDFNAQLTSLKGANPEVIFVPGYYNDVGLIAKQARDKGITVPLIGGDGWDSEQLYKIGGTALNGSYFTNHYSPFDTDPRVVNC